jgi:hypothetical protein
MTFLFYLQQFLVKVMKYHNRKQQKKFLKWGRFEAVLTNIFLKVRPF